MTNTPTVDELEAYYDRRRQAVAMDRVPRLSGPLSITAIQSRTSVVRRKIAYRVAKEGRRPFREDYVYVLFVYDNPLDVWPDFISPDFKFDDLERDDYGLKQTGITGICLVSALRRGDGSIDTSGFLVRTHVFPSASPIVESVKLPR